jgi:Flp pilus assembly protein TadG
MRALLNRLHRFARETEGTAIIETAIALPLAIMLMVGGIEFGRIFLAYATADKTMRDATRYLARVPEDAICATNGATAWGLANAKNLAMYGRINPPANSQPLLPNWTDASTVTLTADPACGSFSKSTMLQLHAEIPFAVFMLTAIGLPNNYTLTVQHQERYIGE